MYIDGHAWVLCRQTVGTWRVNTLRLRQNKRHFADDTFKCIFLNEYDRISIQTSLKFVPKGSINNIPSLVQKLAWCWPGDKPLFEPMMVRLPTHICVTRPQRVNYHWASSLTSPVWSWFIPGCNITMETRIIWRIRSSWVVVTAWWINYLWLVAQMQLWLTRPWTVFGHLNTHTWRIWLSNSRLHFHKHFLERKYCILPKIQLKFFPQDLI